MTKRVSVGRLRVARELCDFAEMDALPGTGPTSAAFRTGFGRIVAELEKKAEA